MENNDKTVPPHLNAEIYRRDTTGTDSVSYLDYVRINTDGSTLIGCSELTGRYWIGGASIFDNVEESQNQDKKSKKSISLNCGTADGCFVDSSSKVLLCGDDGTVSIWGQTVADNWETWSKEASAAEHDNAVLAVDCLDRGKMYITAGADGYIKVWDIKDMICVNSFVAHNEAVYAVAVSPSRKMYATTGLGSSLGSEIVFWEESSGLRVNHRTARTECSVRCCTWLDENKLVVGEESGSLNIVDLRYIRDHEYITKFPAPVHKVEVQKGTSRVAVCCDNNIVTVFDVSIHYATKMIYHDRHIHSNYVRGLAWDAHEKSLLHTVGWDGEIKTHKIPD